MSVWTTRAKSITNGTDVVSMIDTIDPATPTGLQVNPNPNINTNTDSNTKHYTNADANHKP